MISIIVAVDNNNLIGSNNNLPWHIPADLEHFRKITTGHAVIMGRKTFESIGKILPNRINIVISKIAKPKKTEHLLFFDDFKEAVRYAERRFKNEEIFVIGGESIFTQAIDRASKLYVTKIDNVFEGDRYFPVIDKKKWKLVTAELHTKDNVNRYDYAFLEYERL